MKSRMYSHRSRLTRFSALLLTLALMLGLSSCMAEVDSIVCVGSMAPRFAAYLDVMDLLVGAEDSDLDGVDVRYDYSAVYSGQYGDLCAAGLGVRGVRRVHQLHWADCPAHHAPLCGERLPLSAAVLGAVRGGAWR